MTTTYGGQKRRRFVREMPQVGPELRRRYAAARAIWREQSSVRAAAETMEMTERAYCDAYVRRLGPITFLAPSTAGTLPVRSVTWRDYDAAFQGHDWVKEA